MVISILSRYHQHYPEQPYGATFYVFASVVSASSNFYTFILIQTLTSIDVRINCYSYMLCQALHPDTPKICM